MRREVVWYSFDDMIFATEESCEEYEKFYNDAIDEVIHSIRFYDENQCSIDIKGLVTLEDKLNAFEDAINQARYMYIIDSISEDAGGFIFRYMGYILPEGTGWYKYNYEKYKWEKVE